jgi:hypothetical protein
LELLGKKDNTGAANSESQEIQISSAAAITH